MSLKVTVVDEQTGERDEAVLPDGDYLILVTAPAYLATTQTFLGTGTHILTVKGRTQRSAVGQTVHYPPPAARS